TNKQTAFDWVSLLVSSTQKAPIFNRANAFPVVGQSLGRSLASGIETPDFSFLGLEGTGGEEEDGPVGMDLLQSAGGSLLQRFFEDADTGSNLRPRDRAEVDV